MNDQDSPERIPLVPHRYPRAWCIFVFGSLIALICVYAQLPYYWDIKNRIGVADGYLQAGKYEEAIKAYQVLYEEFPSSEKLKIRLAESYFSLQKLEEGNYFLKDLKLSQTEWKEIEKYLPEGCKFQ